MDYFSSMYIDNEMGLDEKKEFVEKIRSDHSFYKLTMDLLVQEQQLQKQPTIPVPEFQRKWQQSIWIRLVRYFKPLGYAVSGFAVSILVFFIVFQPRVCPVSNNRFVLFQPGVQKVELAGSFTQWQRVSMKQIGNSGYWELNFPVASGEHRFAYILDNDRQIADPTLPGRERDDFGGVNSILSIEEPI